MNHKGKAKVLDFSSSLYLGFEHSSQEIGRWDNLTTGVPAAIQEHKHASFLANQIAQLQGLERGLIYPSTLHAFTDLFTTWPDSEKFQLFYDSDLYEIGKLGVKLGKLNGIRTSSFPHFNHKELRNKLDLKLEKGKKPIIVTDGFCPLCGKLAPLRQYMDIIKPYDGFLILDDTQALGILGQNPDSVMPYGYYGGGSLKWLNLSNSRIISVSSLVKGFGAPLTIITGAKNCIDNLSERSETRLYSSPPSIVHLMAGVNGIKLNARKGWERRKHLLEMVKYFRFLLGFTPSSMNDLNFPVQYVDGLSYRNCIRIYQKLALKNIKTNLVRNHNPNDLRLMLIFRSRHTYRDIERLCYMLNLFTL